MIYIDVRSIYGRYCDYIILLYISNKTQKHNDVRLYHITHTYISYLSYIHTSYTSHTVIYTSLQTKTDRRRWKSNNSLLCFNFLFFVSKTFICFIRKDFVCIIPFFCYFNACFFFVKLRRKLQKWRDLWYISYVQ